MSDKLTLRAIAELQKSPPSKDRLIPEGTIAGLYLKARPSGGHSWILRYAPGDGTSQERRRGVTLTLGPLATMSLEQARQAAVEQLSSINSGIDPAQERRRARGIPT